MQDDKHAKAQALLRDDLIKLVDSGPGYAVFMVESLTDGEQFNVYYRTQTGWSCNHRKCIELRAGKPRCYHVLACKLKSGLALARRDEW